MPCQAAIPTCRDRRAFTPSSALEGTRRSDRRETFDPTVGGVGLQYRVAEINIAYPARSSIKFAAANRRRLTAIKRRDRSAGMDVEVVSHGSNRLNSAARTSRCRARVSMSATRAPVTCAKCLWIEMFNQESEWIRDVCADVASVVVGDCAARVGDVNPSSDLAYRGANCASANRPLQRALVRARR